MKLLTEVHAPFLDIPQNLFSVIFFTVVFSLLICRTSKNLVRFNLQQLSHPSQAAAWQILITSLFHTLLNTNSISVSSSFYKHLIGYFSFKTTSFL